ncbi:hypothetical protein [Microbacterium sp. H1-D42]|uniref:hypothetical protein n=1 Tax=Microbacterium sp. H1-D42 TaxID=2925844 RepID=UPI001F534BE2|nr:hypothetical protein [Microbacterium sp. H1-D42]UNK70543.1 hypothetical protein MNR00_15490 [Microbacterium sp. H1-D42]
MNFPSRRSFVRMLVALLLLAVNLRLAVTSAAALLTLLIGDGALTPQAAVLVPALPTAMFAIAGVFTPWLSRRLGAGSAVSWAMVILIAGLLLRSIPHPIAIVAGTAFATAGIAVVNVLMPALVRAAAGTRIRAVTTAYTTLMSLAAALGAAAAVPSALLLGSSSLGLGMWALPAMLALVVWMLVARSADVNGAMASRASDSGRPLPAGTWALTGFFALQALSSYVLMGWLPTIAIDAGIDPTRAGMLLAIVMLLSIPAAIAAVSVSHSVVGVRVGVVVVGITSIAGMLGFWLAPTLAPEVWAGLLGIGSAAFPLALALIARAGSSAADTARVSGVAQGVGYAIATLGPLGAGAWHGLGGDWGAVLAVLVVGAALQAAIGLALAAPGRRRSDAFPTPPSTTTVPV